MSPWLYLRRWLRRCHHRHPTLDSDEWGTSFDGTADVYCSRHHKPRWAGKRPIDDLPFARQVVETLAEIAEERS